MVNDTLDETGDGARRAATPMAKALAVAWCVDASRVGEVLFVDETPHVFGRGDAEDGDGRPRARLVRQRPHETTAAAPLELPALSRAQLELRLQDGRVHVQNLGKRPLLDGAGETAPALVVSPGDAFEIKGQVVFVCVSRERRMAPLRSLASPAFPFGGSDVHGLVGESAAAWELREQAAFVAARAAHVLVLGDSGSGKELVAQAIHAASKRGRRPMVARNAATIPSGLADAELFGNLANYPNPGMPERKGLVGEADGSTLFLDEIGELPEELQARLLRVLDERGEYQRLGDAKPRRADIRLVGATNRPVAALKHDVAARFRLRLRVPGFQERREDILLIARHLLARVAATDAEIGERFFDGKGEPRIAAALARRLVLHDFRTHGRELDALLWRSIATSPEDVLELTPDVEAELTQDTPAPVTSRRLPVELSAEEIRAALARANGVQERAWRDLGLANRYVLKRLIAKMGIASGGDGGP